MSRPSIFDTHTHTEAPRQCHNALPLASPQRIVIMGSYGGANVGDEMILDAVLHIIRRAARNSIVTVVGLVDVRKVESLTAAHYRAREIRFICARNLPAVAGQAWGSQLVIGGGQVVDGASGPKLALSQLVTAIFARLGGGQVCIGGAGVFRVNSWSTRCAYSALFALCRRIVVRDAGSLRALGFSAAVRRTGRVGADAVFALRDELRVADPLAKSVGDFVFAVHHAPHASYLAFDEALQLARRLVGLLPAGARLRVAAHDSRESFDLGFARRLLEQLSCDRVDLVTFKCVDECRNLYRAASVVVSARMHPLIIGACADCACVPLDGSEKVEELAARLAIPKWRCDALLALDDLALRAAINVRPSVVVLSELAKLARTAFEDIIYADTH